MGIAILHLLPLPVGNRLTACAVQGSKLEKAEISASHKEMMTGISYEARGCSLQAGAGLAGWRDIAPLLFPFIKICKHIFISLHYAKPSTIFAFRKKLKVRISASDHIKRPCKTVVLYGRGERTQTFDLSVPNRARYQLRHTPIGGNLSDYSLFCR